MKELVGRHVPFEERLVFIDCETTGLINKDICQIGALVCENGFITKAISEYVKPLGENSTKRLWNDMALQVLLCKIPLRLTKYGKINLVS